MLSEIKRQRNEGTIGTLMKDQRATHGFTQKALADVIGIEHYTMISQMERGHMSIPPALWVPIANALRMDRQEWVLMCLREIQPEVYGALFGVKTITETAAALQALERGDYEQPLASK